MISVTDPIICPFCGAKYVIASSPAALAALQAEQRELAPRRPRSRLSSRRRNGELPAVEGEEALVDVEAEDTATGEDDETFLQEEEEEGGDVTNIIGGPAGGRRRALERSRQTSLMFRPGRLIRRNAAGR